MIQMDTLKLHGAHRGYREQTKATGNMNGTTGGTQRLQGDTKGLQRTHSYRQHRGATRDTQELKKTQSVLQKTNKTTEDTITATEDIKGLQRIQTHKGYKGHTRTTGDNTEAYNYKLTGTWSRDDGDVIYSDVPKAWLAN